MNKRLLSMLLALCMIVTMLPVSAMAEEIHTTIGGSREIISFAPLTETEKTVSPGKSGEDLELPETLTATVRTAVPADENPVQDSGSQQTATPATTTEPQWEETTVEIPVTWVSPGYDMNTEGEYVFTPVVESYTVSAPLPEIVVTVGEMPPIAAARGLAAPMAEPAPESDDVAQIGSTGYATLQQAVDSAAEGQIIKLVADITITSAIQVNTAHSFTLDLNGHPISCSAAVNTIVKASTGTLTITDSQGNGEIVGNTSAGASTVRVLSDRRRPCQAGARQRLLAPGLLSRPELRRQRLYARSDFYRQHCAPERHCQGLYS